MRSFARTGPNFKNGLPERGIYHVPAPGLRCSSLLTSADTLQQFEPFAYPGQPGLGWLIEAPLPRSEGRERHFEHIGKGALIEAKGPPEAPQALWEGLRGRLGVITEEGYDSGHERGTGMPQARLPFGYGISLRAEPRRRIALGEIEFIPLPPDMLTDGLRRR